MRFVVVIAALALVSCAAEEAAPPRIDPRGHPTAASFLSCLEGKAALVSAHRGGPAPGYPENAIETFERTLAQVPALIETDVRETADGVLVLLHDETIDRTTNGTGRIAEMTLAEAKSFFLVDADGNLTDFTIPTLAEALRAMRGRTILQLDVKRGIDLRKVAEAVARVGDQPNAAIITYTDNGAIIAASAAEGISVVAGIDAAEDARSLAARGLPTDRLIAWTGVIQSPEPMLYETLGRADISTSGGALGTLDDASADGEENVYRTLVELGLDIIATDRPVEAAREIGAEALGAALETCAVRKG